MKKEFVKCIKSVPTFLAVAQGADEIGLLVFFCVRLARL